MRMVSTNIVACSLRNAQIRFRVRQYPLNRIPEYRLSDRVIRRIKPCLINSPKRVITRVVMVVSNCCVERIMF